MTAKTRTIRIHGTEHPTIHDALVELNFSGDHVITIGGKVLSIDDAELSRLQNMGIQPTTWHHFEPTAQIMSVPGNI